MAQLPFDLARGPLLRAVVLRFANSEHVLLLVTHYIAFDTWAIGLLLRELAALYTANLKGEPAALRQQRDQPDRCRGAILANVDSI